MPEFLSNFSNQLTEYWNKFTTKQKIQIIVVVVIGLATLIGLTLILSRPSYALYSEDISPEQMNSIITVLSENNIDYRYEDNATTLYVDSSKFQDVKLLLVDQGVLTTSDFQWKDAWNTSITTTSDQVNMMYQLAFETELGDIIEMIEAVDTARVKIVIPDRQEYILQEARSASASVMLYLNSDLTDDQITGIASMVETAVENLSMEDIRIMDARTSKLLYNGSSASGTVGSVTSYLEIQTLYEDKYEREIERLLLNSGEYDDAQVDVNLKFDFDEVVSESESYARPEGGTGGLPTSVYIYESKGTSTTASGTPGTDSNADTTTYLVDNGSGSDSSTSVNDTDYLYDRTTESRKKAQGDIIPTDSSVTVMLNKYTTYYQDSLIADGTLANTTWEQFKIDNNVRTSITVDQSIVDFIANASMIDNVVVMATNVPIFMDSAAANNQVADYIPVIIIVLMIALLGYAVYKGTEPVEITEVEPELSVEEMLSTTRVSEELEAIELEDKSEARVQIERFVEENPEAVAMLLRNWLNEDWE